MSNYDYFATRKEKQQPIFIPLDLPPKLVDAIFQKGHGRASQAVPILLQLFEQPAAFRPNRFSLAPQELKRRSATRFSLIEDELV